MNDKICIHWYRCLNHFYQESLKQYADESNRPTVLEIALYLRKDCEKCAKCNTRDSGDKITVTGRSLSQS